MAEPELFPEVLEDAADVVAAGDSEGRFVAVNRAAERLTGYRRDELIGEPFSKIVAPEYAAVVAEQIRRKAEGAKSAVYEIDVIAKDGTRIPVEISSTAVRSDGRHLGQLAIARDLRDRRAIEEQLREAQKMEAVGRLGRTLAHDFNNALLVMRGYGELMLTRLEEGHPARAHAERIIGEAERASTLTRSLLAFAREAPLHPRPVDLDAELERMVAAVRALVGQDVDVELRHDGATLVQADPAAVEQMVLNVAANARDAMPEGGSLTFETKTVVLGALEAETLPTLSPGRYRVLRVADTGVGMDDETRERAFDPLFTTKPPDEGTGLGLSMVYSLVHQLGGHVTIRSQPGAGTTVSLYLRAVN